MQVIKHVFWHSLEKHQSNKRFTSIGGGKLRWNFRCLYFFIVCLCVWQRMGGSNKNKNEVCVVHLCWFCWISRFIHVYFGRKKKHIPIFFVHLQYHVATFWYTLCFISLFYCCFSQIDFTQLFMIFSLANTHTQSRICFMFILARVFTFFNQFQFNGINSNIHIALKIEWTLAHKYTHHNFF